jgi:hypothetical protein
MLLIDSIIISKPTNKIRKLITIEEIYSILACPNGWPRSAGFEEILKLIKVTTEDAASEKLLSESAMIADEEDRSPAMSFISARRKLRQIPTTPDNVP